MEILLTTLLANVYTFGAKSDVMIGAKSYPLLSRCFRMSKNKYCFPQCLRQR